MARRTEKKSFAAAYIDTSALIAFLDRSDSYHSPFKRLFASPPPLVTSALVVAEDHGWFPSRYDWMRAAEFLAFIGSLPALAIAAFDGGGLSSARLILAKFSDRNFTLADAHGLAIMKDRHADWRSARIQHV